MKMLPSATVKTYTMFFSSSLFFQLWPIGCVGYSVFGLCWQVDLYDSFEQQFLSGPRYVVNSCCLMSDKRKQKTIRYIHSVLLYLFYTSVCIAVVSIFFFFEEKRRSWMRKKFMFIHLRVNGRL